MRRILSLALSAAMGVVLPLVSAAQQSARIEELINQLKTSATSEKAYEQLKVLAKQDPESRQYIAGRLPSLIRTSDDELVLWLNAVSLAGDLKVTEAVPILVPLLHQDHRSGPTNFGLEAQLYDDPVVKALSEIGDSATETVAQLFEKGDPPTRRRAAVVLSNIASPAAMQALRRQANQETDPKLKAFMADRIK